ncbi:alkaline phosphatase [Kribbella sp. ALI-6-A]|uniref:alkaline phosphatase D family protein n=1 Tax=Kribbella sp. ALI-6-A TaxID=1933817 RepID=UPI00097C3296|nr:alkaline phosphatase D family protein [Kribbella sp. ALI-6-A]ONI70028.1 alkaline phosphatase [Kribbella sp. ALI-6-A]
MPVTPITRRTLLVAATTVAGATAVAATGTLPAAGSPLTDATAAGPSQPLANPFTLGIASGDPDYQSVVLWTRLALDPLAADGMGGMPSRRYQVQWQVALDPGMRRVVRAGVVSAGPESAHAVHVEVRGLLPGREYYYRFRCERHLSEIGRTLTTPLPGTYGSPLHMAFVSCSNYAGGYFTAYRRMAEEHPSLVLHLGDYIYEGAGGTGPRTHSPAKEIWTLADYRVRHAQYRTDPDLQAAHAVAPWVVVWDDHELENNYADEIPSPAGQAGFLERRAAAYRAYYEMMPLRRSSIPSGIDMQIYRRIQWGRLASFHMLDTRQYRSDQACNDTTSDCPAALDPARSITGPEQEKWLLDGLGRSSATWDVLGQQVFFGARDFTSGPAVSYSMDAWDGYAASRQRILDGFQQRNVTNPVVLTGDVHKHYANNLLADFRDPDSRPVGVELVTTSITSGGDGQDFPSGGQVQLDENPHIKLLNNQRGYVSTHLTRDSLRADFKVIPYVSTPGAPVSTRASFTVEAGHPGLNPA